MQFLTSLLFPLLVSAAAITHRDARPRALYFLDSNPAGSKVVAMKINNDNGMLSDQVSIPTGQLGGPGLVASKTPGAAAAPPAADSLFSQGSITVADDYLFAVNTMNSSISVFSIDPKNPTALKLINSASSMGDFPNSVTYSSDLCVACVVNSGHAAGVACFSVDNAKGLEPITSLMPIATVNSNPPVGPFNTSSDIQFSPNSKYLMVSVKSHSGTTPGAIYVYPIIRENISSKPVITVLPEIDVNFGFSFISENRIVISDATVPSAYEFITVDPKTFVTKLESKTIVKDSMAFCWTAYSSRFNTAFIADGANPNITMVNPATGAVKGTLFQSAAQKGALDIVIDRNYLYNLGGGSLISVSDLTGLNNKAGPNIALNSAVQAFTLSGNRASYVGLAVYPSS